VIPDGCALQFNPSYGTYVLYHDGGPEKNVKMKKYRGGSKDRTQEEFSGATSANMQMPRRGRRRIKVDDGENVVLDTSFDCVEPSL
jgi:hypothetical protein